MRTATYAYIAVMLLCLIVAQCAGAQEMTIGAKEVGTGPICKSQESMVLVAKADSEDGIQMAVGVLKALPDCAILTFEVKLVRIVFEAETSRGKTVRVVEVLIEMQEGPAQTYYILTDLPLSGNAV